MHSCILLFTWLKKDKYKQKQINAQVTSKQIWHATTNNYTNLIHSYLAKIKDKLSLK